MGASSWVSRRNPVIVLARDSKPVTQKYSEMGVREMGRNVLTIYLYETPTYSSEPDPMPETAVDFIAWLQGLIDTVPEEHRSSVIIDVGDDGDYDCPAPQLSVYWQREETDEEQSERLAAESIDSRRRLEDAARRAKMEYERLQREIDAWFKKGT